MGVIGNNLANSNTAGFKASRTLFSDLIPDTVSGSGGTSQVGRGSGLSTVDDIFTQGSIESTSSNLDLAIEGTGFFMVRNPDAQASSFTRSGAFRLNEEGYMINPEGYIVQGYARLADGQGFNDLTGDIQINTRSSVPGEASSQVDLTTNLNANTTIRDDAFDVGNPVGTSNFATTSEIYDSLGNTHLVTTYFRKTGLNQWTYHQTVPGADLEGTYAEDEIVEVGRGTLLFDESGLLQKIGTGQRFANTVEQTAPGEDGVSQTVYEISGLSLDDNDYVAGGVLQVVIDGNTIEVDMVDGSATDSLDALEAAIDGVDGLGATRVDGTITITADDNGENSFEVSSASSWLPGVEGSSVDIMDQEDEDWPVVTTIAAGELNWKNGARQGDELDYQMSITQFSTESRVVTQQSDGYSSGYLTDISVDMEGIITGTYSNGESRSLARLALGKFANDNGLEKLGNNLYGPTRSSGPADIGTPGAGFGRIFSNSLEQSTVDIAEEFTRMITTQRAFQANSKTITTTDEMLSEVINMKR
jgi:flagellar hook protein FlgE